MKIAARAALSAMKTAYAGLKLLPQKQNKVVLLSRQSDSLPLDFELLKKRLAQKHPRVEVSAVHRRLEPTLVSGLLFSWALARSMYHLATAKVAVLDSYWPAVSALDHKKGLKVFQMWHAMGKIKQSGRITAGKSDGRDQAIATLMRQHEGYDYVVAGGEFWNPFYRESFHVEESALLNIGLPRADFLLENREATRKRFTELYPDLAQGPTVLYAPTFRAGGRHGSSAKNLVEALAPAGYKVIVKGHSNQKLDDVAGEHWLCPEFSAPELLNVVDFLVTDYSAIAVEAALVGTPTFYFLYDLEEYLQTNGLNIDLPAEVPSLVLETPQQVADALAAPYPQGEYEAYRQKVLFENPGQSTDQLVRALIEKGGLCTR